MQPVNISRELKLAVPLSQSVWACAERHCSAALCRERKTAGEEFWQKGTRSLWYSVLCVREYLEAKRLHLHTAFNNYGKLFLYSKDSHLSIHYVEKCCFLFRFSLGLKSSFLNQKCSPGPLLPSSTRAAPAPHRNLKDSSLIKRNSREPTPDTVLVFSGFCFCLFTNLYQLCPHSLDHWSFIWFNFSTIWSLDGANSSPVRQ